MNGGSGGVFDTPVGGLGRGSGQKAGPGGLAQWLTPQKVNSAKPTSASSLACWVSLCRSTRPTALTVKLAKDSRPRSVCKVACCPPIMWGAGLGRLCPPCQAAKAMGVGNGGSEASRLHGAVMRAAGTVGVTASFSPQSRVQPRQVKVFGAIVLPYYTLYRSNCSTFDSFNARWVR